MDNRLGCYVALEAARLVAEGGGAPGDVVAVAAVQEEITFGGARTTAFAVQPDIAIIVDVTHATDVPGIEEREEGAHHFGAGPVIGRGSILHPPSSRPFLRRRRGRGDPLPRCGLRGGRRAPTPTRVHFTRAGIPCGS